MLSKHISNQLKLLGLIILSLFLSLLLVLVSGFSGKSQEDDIVLGMSAAFTGASRSLGIELYRGSMAYIEDINRQGGINGKQIVIQAYDDGYNPTRAIKNTINLIENDDVFLLFDTGIDYTTNLINSQVVPSYNDTSLAAVSDYRALMDQYNPMPPKNFSSAEYKPLRYSFVSLEGFLNAKLLVVILQMMGDKVDKARLRQALEKVKNLDLGMGASHI
ncbi:MULTISPECIES: ABC transporter substrate-binding protein [Moorena]|uniref:Leucine-binding protein domain-containing protein n=1 Tax=Moorena bouillonii PNG TaxID=568701 RepID=A0A1U7N1J6_9CYAN|nr:MULTISPECIES: ABC transporter substrate-binding protein [Moorena]NEO11969.1 ABC transporter substrate-binding protein [Moorena sp. SIO3E8]NEO25043.1 ABC transporter substrate-binding protein [Moorena sp. SIO4A5]NEP99018.1 ABC transporter substrate-binding protein [Moorena sp. SIO3F7]OLT59827.1 hypothetical protein BJP37_13140 [Moorena bouillonii PNG]